MQAQQLIEFLGNHPLLTLAFVAVNAGLVWTFVAGRTQAGVSVSPQDAVRLIGHEDAVVVDVRSDSEFAAGHIVNSMHVAESTLKDSPGKLQKHKSRPLILVCKTGQRAGSLAAGLRKQGFERAVVLHGGLNAWQNAGLPLEKK